MFSASQMDTGGAGFFSSQLTQNDQSQVSAKNRDAQPMVPVTVKQINDAFQSSDDKSSFTIDGVNVNNVMIVGMTFDKSVRVTDVAFVIDDGTGRINCHRWVNDAVDTKEVEGISDGTYVRVHGHLKSFQGKVQLVVFAVRQVSNYDEVSSHFLSCIHYHSYTSKREQNGLVAPSSGQVSSSLVSNISNGHQSTPLSQFSGHHNMDGLKGIDKMIIEYLEQPSSVTQEKGVHKNEIAQHLKLSVEKITEAIESLESEGLIYSTIDECHYKSTSS